jgi:hypothetical protein
MNVFYGTKLVFGDLPEISLPHRLSLAAKSGVHFLDPLLLAVSNSYVLGVQRWFVAALAAAGPRGG